jgi:hypothetical protein
MSVSASSVNAGPTAGLSRLGGIVHVGSVDGRIAVAGSLTSHTTPPVPIKIPSYLPAFVSPPVYYFCIPPNPILQALRLHAELNLYKLQHCLNIAGMQQQLDPYAAPTDTMTGLPMIGSGGQLVLPGAVTLQPTPYRYTTLIERAKQLVQLAAQIEAAMLSALEKRDNEYYNALKARQDTELARAGVRLQDLRVREAGDGVQLAQLQQERAQIQVDHYTQLLAQGISDLELQSLGLLAVSAGLQFSAAGTLIGAAAAGAASVTDVLSFGSNTATQIASGLSSLAAGISTQASIASTLASYERRAEEWQFQKSLAQQDVRIGAQQVTTAEDHVRVVGQERVIAQMQADHAAAMVDFLSNKFTNVELYEWMSNVLEGVYSFFLQQATAMAQLAANQLGFERQEVPPPYIQADYWQAPNDTGAVTTTDGQAPDRRGLTGSARLMQDIFQLDQYAFQTNKRKLQLSKIISLVQLDPYAFARFQQTGVLSFATPMEMFDRDFPGHYLRLIRRVRTTVIALIPPAQGIRATLTNGGLARVVIGGDTYQMTTVRRDPELVALSAPTNASGIFELDPQADLLLPFEGTGVDTTWEFRLPKAANPFDYSTIADVLVTIDYTALNSFEYRQQVIQTLDPRLSAQRPFSFRQQLADQWYDLHNPLQTTTPMKVTFTTAPSDFPANLDDLSIQHVTLYFALADGVAPFEVAQVSLTFTEQGGTGSVGGAADTRNGVISTRYGDGASWIPMIGKRPFGTWQLDLSGDTLNPATNNPSIQDHLANEDVTDILLVMTFTAHTPPWP